MHITSNICLVTGVRLLVFIGNTCAFDGNTRITATERRDETSPRAAHARGTARLTHSGALAIRKPPYTTSQRSSTPNSNAIYIFPPREKSRLHLVGVGGIWPLFMSRTLLFTPFTGTDQRSLVLVRIAADLSYNYAFWSHVSDRLNQNCIVHFKCVTSWSEIADNDGRR